MPDSTFDFYGNRVRVRASGICIVDERLLLIHHDSPSLGNFWAPPGGGIDFGEMAETCVSREFQEETGLSVDVGRFLFAGEFIKSPLHAIELFFEVFIRGGDLRTGRDPEMDEKNQIIGEARFLSEGEIRNMERSALHGLFQMTNNPSEILDLRGYFKL